MPSASRLPSTMPMTPLPAGESKPRTCASSSLRSAAAATIAAASGCSLPRSTLAASRSTCASSKPGAGDDRDDLRLAFGQRAGLVDDQRVDLFHALERFGVLDQHAGLRAAADADHDRHRRGEAQRAGAGDDQHAHRGDQAVGEARLRPEHRPGGKGDERDRDHRRHEPAGDLVGQPLDRRAAALRLRHHLHDLRQQRVAADLVGAHHEAAGGVERAADHARVFAPWSPAWIRRSPWIHRARSGLRARRRRPAPSRRAARAGGRRPATASSETSSSLPSALTRRAVFGARSSSARIAPEVASRARSSSTWPSSTSTVITRRPRNRPPARRRGARNAGGKMPGANVATTL